MLRTVRPNRSWSGSTVSGPRKATQMVVFTYFVLTRVMLYASLTGRGFETCES